MKMPTATLRLTLVHAPVLALAALCLTGCSLIGFERTAKNERAADSLATAATELRAESQTLDATIAALNDRHGLAACVHVLSDSVAGPRAS